MDLEKLRELWRKDEADVQATLEQVCALMDDIGSTGMRYLRSGEEALVLPYDVWEVAGKLNYLCGRALEKLA